MTQKDAVILTLKEKGKITSWQAFKDWGITRLASIIFELRKEHTIVSKSITKKNRFGHSVTFSEYTLTDQLTLF